MRLSMITEDVLYIMGFALVSFSFSTMSARSLMYFSILSSFGLFLSLMLSTMPLNWKNPLLRQIMVRVMTSSLFLVRSIIWVMGQVRLWIFWAVWFQAGVRFSWCSLLWGLFCSHCRRCWWIWSVWIRVYFDFYDVFLDYFFVDGFCFEEQMFVALLQEEFLLVSVFALEDQEGANHESVLWEHNIE